ncbi:two-component system, sensor histidine kinase YesM [Paenibacillus sp. UNCCL117]|uniref:sensor histidine kinase n=1 Tax=unclassified Paenibacillus TaxID=185978 RepID=UPI000891D59B|nr:MULTISPECIES: sensor histidine kinase [unclassified Paenibacillus]SDD69156.1 two-component system, sensor histidine kinase YesM [Paenibacillus sp. cl123]SFW45085.1 two-component system, sensor histidine kinase YesM [Paenibacillus sp. UNCCL117]
MIGRIEGLFRYNPGLSMTKKVIVLYLFIVLLPGCLLMYGYYSRTSSIIERDMSESMLQTLKQSEANIADRLGNIENISNSLIANQDVFRFLSSLEKHPAEQFEHFQAMEKLLAGAERSHDVQRIRLFVRPQLTYANESLHFFPLTDIGPSSPWYDRMMAQNGAIYWRSSYRQTYLGGEDAAVVSAVRMLRDPADFEAVIGVLSVDVKEELLRELMQRIELAPSQDIAIMDRSGALVYHADSTRLGQQSVIRSDQLESMFRSSEGYVHDTDDSGHSLLFRRIALTDWMIVVKLPTRDVSGESVALTKISVVLALAGGSVVFIFLLVVVFSLAVERLGKRIRELIRLIKTGGIERFDENWPQAGDLRMLEQGIARMVQTVQDLTAESYQAKLHERDAQLKALQAQINPHFLYNTLDSMNWMAIRREADDISQMIDSLSTYFRLSLSKGRDVVTLDEELQLIRSYMHIHNTRDAGIRMQYDLEEAALPRRLPKLTLQPIVENAVLHGIGQKRPKQGVITIAARLDGPLLAVTVTDDGIGMPPSKLEKLFQPPSSELAATSYGLYNVSERIRLYSQDASCGVFIESEPGAGTTVRLRIRTDARGQE